MSVAPGLAAAPIVGALLDRYGRLRLMTLDYLVTTAAMVLVATLATIHELPDWLLVAITFVFGVTSMFSSSGLRSLFPLIVPTHLWERVNAIDSNGYLLATIVGPPVAATLVTTIGGPATFGLMAIPFAVAAVALVGVTEPVASGSAPGGLLREALIGIRYFWRNATLRGLGVAFAVSNVAGGFGTILIPVIILDRLSAPAPMVGFAFAVSGVVGVASALLAGRIDSNGREWRMLVVAMTGLAAASALLYPAATAGDQFVGLAWIFGAMAILGLSSGLSDVALFTVRQRRTDPQVFGRAITISMAFNYSGFPIGAAIAGSLVTASLEFAIVLAVVAGVVGMLLVAAMVPRLVPMRAD